MDSQKGRNPWRDIQRNICRLLLATAVAMSWQHGSGGQKDWGMVLGVAFGVPFLCCSVAALLSFFVSVSTHNVQTIFGLRQPRPSL